MRNRNWKTRFYSVLTAAAISFGMMSAAPVSVGNAADFKQGDCNGDGALNDEDTQYLLDALVGKEAIENLSAGADMDANGSINAIDLVLLRDYLKNYKPNVTLLIYQCGSDLESGSNEATDDLLEMLTADYSSKNLTLVLETGGSNRWFNTVSKSDANYRITVENNELLTKKISDKPKNMGDSKTLLDFINEETKLHPADRYGLILWNHGGGPLLGVCFDEQTNDNLLLPEVTEALEKCGKHFDWIGFDACLMGSFEVAYALRNYADYLVASEEAESGFGWYYTDYISEWSNHTDIPTKDLVTKIVDDTINFNQRANSQFTLAAYDLSKVQPMMDALTLYIEDVVNSVRTNGVVNLKEHRSRAVDFGNNQYDLVDISSMMTAFPTSHSANVMNAFSNLVIYSREYMKQGATGMSFWFPEYFPEDYLYLDYVFPPIGINAEYTKMMKAIAKSWASGRIVMGSEDVVRTDPIIQVGLEQLRKLMNE